MVGTRRRMERTTMMEWFFGGEGCWLVRKGRGGRKWD